MNADPSGVAVLELAAAALGGGAVGWWLHRAWSRTRTVPARPEPPRPDGAVAGPSAATPVSHAVETTPPPPVATRPSPPASPPPGPSAGDQGLGLARRVIVHLSVQGRLGRDEVAPVAFTQRGMASALAVRQGNLSKVLQRLVAAGALEVDRRHVRGADRRLYVYRLTALGESIALDLRRRRS